MDFRFDDEQEALRDAVHTLCAEHFDLTRVASREGAPLADATWHALADMGVLSMLVPTDGGGFGGGVVEAAIVFEQLGLHLATGPILWSTITAPLLPAVDVVSTRVTGIDVGSTPSAPYVVDHAGEAALLVVVTDSVVTRVVTADLGAPAGAAPLDPLTPTAAYEALPAGTAIGGPDDARVLRLRGTVLAAAQLVGAAQGALDVASAYALERHQFGVPIGSFQAVKHLLADMYVRVELARSAMYAAAAIADDPRAGDVTGAANTAKLLAGEAGIANGRTAVQILGGMGFTWEMLPHYFLKRAWLLEQTFGTGEAHALALGAALDRDVRAVTAWT